MKNITPLLLAISFIFAACAPVAPPTAAPQPATQTSEVPQSPATETVPIVTGTATDSIPPTAPPTELPATAPAIAPIGDRPRGIFVLAGLGGENGTTEKAIQNFNTVVNLDYVEGITIGFSWKDTEKSPGQYDFSKVDAVMSALQTTDKKLNIEAFAVDVPEWLVAQLPAEETWEAHAPGRRTVKTAVPWSPTALSAWRNYMQALADHPITLPDGSTVQLADHPNLMMVDAPVVGLQGLRDLTKTLTTLPGYSRETFVNAVVDSVHTSRGAFPNKFGFIAFFSMHDADTIYSLDQNLLDRFMQDFNNPGQTTLGFFQENLSDAGPTPDGLGKNLLAAKDRTYILFQALTAWSKPFTGENKVTSGNAATGIQFAYESYDATYVEIYLADALDPAQADALRHWNGILTGAASP